MAFSNRRTALIVVLILIVLVTFGLVVGLIVYPYLMEKGITAKQAKKLADEYIEEENIDAVFYSVRTDGEMINEGDFDHWYVDYHKPVDENGNIGIIVLKVNRDDEVSQLTTLIHPYRSDVPTVWNLDSDDAFKAAKKDKDIDKYLDTNEDDVDIEEFVLTYYHDTQEFQWTILMKNEGWVEKHDAQVVIDDATGDVLSSNVVYY